MTVTHFGGGVTQTITQDEIRWELNGVLHREDGPARSVRGWSHEWYRHGKLHREDGPAIESVDGCYWYLNGKLWPEGAAIIAARKELEKNLTDGLPAARDINAVKQPVFRQKKPKKTL